MKNNSQRNNEKRIRKPNRYKFQDDEEIDQIIRSCEKQQKSRKLRKLSQDSSIEIEEEDESSNSQYESDYNDDYCWKCLQKNRPLLCCDSCYRSFHMACVGIKKMPYGQWYWNTSTKQIYRNSIRIDKPSLQSNMKIIQKIKYKKIRITQFIRMKNGLILMTSLYANMLQKEDLMQLNLLMSLIIETEVLNILNVFYCSQCFFSQTFQVHFPLVQKCKPILKYHIKIVIQFGFNGLKYFRHIFILNFLVLHLNVLIMLIQEQFISSYVHFSKLHQVSLLNKWLYIILCYLQRIEKLSNIDYELTSNKQIQNL